ncbi:MAG: hypothetical protein ACP5NF_03245 [Thermoanaerobaculum sp.]
MKRLAVLVALSCTTAFAAEKTLTFSQPLGELAAVKLAVGAGDVTVTACTCSEVTATVTVSGKRWQLEELEVVPKIEGKTLQLALEPRTRGNKKLGEDWRLQLPRSLSFTVHAGVGDVRISGLWGDVEVQLGVGDVRVEGLSGNLKAETGVGDVEVFGQWGNVGRLRLTTGVGSVSVRTPQGKLAGHGLVSEALSEEGPGRWSVRISTGVGDITLHLKDE